MPRDRATESPDQSHPAPRVSVGIPCYQAEQWLGATLESVLAQSERDIEVIVSDNASTDGSFAVAQAWAARDPRVRVYRQEKNLGAPGNYRFVAQQARGRYFKWMATSDLVSDNFLAECVAALEADPGAVLACGRTVLFAESPADGRDYDDNIDLRSDDPIERYDGVQARLRLNNAINGVIRREALLRTGVMPNYYSCDNVVLAELALHGKILQIPSATFYRRMRPETATRLKGEEETRRHYYPTARAGMFFQEWQLCLGYLAAAFRAPLKPGQRARLIKRTLKLCYWNLPRLWEDVVHAGRRLVTRRA